VPVDRQWTVPEDEQHLPNISVTEDGDLLVQPRVVHEDDSDATLEALLEALAILRRVGGTIQIASQRGEVAPNVVVTESYIFAYNSFTPLVRRLEQQDFEEGHADDVGDEHDFPSMEEGAAGEAIAQAQAEVPADAEPEPAGIVE
jgi:hypothetical protein